MNINELLKKYLQCLNFIFISQPSNQKKIRGLYSNSEC